MTDNLIFIVDSSSSVQAYAQPYVNALNEIVQIQKRINPNTSLTCALFNERIQYLCVNHPIRDLSDGISMQNFTPMGLTAFYDNVSVIIHNLLKFYKNNNQTGPTVVILTDGEDTCSNRISPKRAALQIAMAKARGWQFIYLGVNENSLRIGRELGFNTCILYSCSSQGFSKIPEIMSLLLPKRRVPNVDVDIRDLTDALSGVKIN